MILTEKEQRDIQEFIIKHHKKCGNGKIKVILSKNTGLGRAIVVKCNICKKAKDVSEYKAW